MQVLFDLRPATLVHSQEKRVDAIRLLSALLFVVFFMVSGFNIVYTWMHWSQVRGELKKAQTTKESIQKESVELESNRSILQGFMDKTRVYLDFARQEVPSVEFLAALEDMTPQGLKISLVEIKPGSVHMRGSALTDQEVVEFAARLEANKNIIERVEMPVTTKSTVGNQIIAEFAVTGTLKSILDIEVHAPVMPISTESEEVEKEQ